MENEQRPGWFARLQKRWGVSAQRALIILIVFACTGFSVMFLKAPLLNLLIGEEERSVIHSVIYYILILPIYNILLLIYGFLFGQFQFFWDFEKRFFNRMLGRKRKTEV
jgi:Na+-driven multidrug efflux pump